MPISERIKNHLEGNKIRYSRLCTDGSRSATTSVAARKEGLMPSGRKPPSINDQYVSVHVIARA